MFTEVRGDFFHNKSWFLVIVASGLLTIYSLSGPRLFCQRGFSPNVSITIMGFVCIWWIWKLKLLHKKKSFQWSTQSYFHFVFITIINSPLSLFTFCLKHTVIQEGKHVKLLPFCRRHIKNTLNISFIYTYIYIYS